MLIWDNKVYEALVNQKTSYRVGKKNKSNKLLIEEKQKTKQIRKKLVRKHKRQVNKKIVEDIEKLRCENPKEYWRKLKELNNKEVEQNLPNKMKNEIMNGL